MEDITIAAAEKLGLRISSIKEFLYLHPEYNREIVFLIDMRIASGKNRFFVCNLKTGNIIDQGLVAHGIGSETGNSELQFSNVNNSYSTALGKYSIGQHYNGKFGKAYKLHGLDETNSNAFLRNIVLHKLDTMPHEEQEEKICNSQGCPMVSERFFSRIEKIIDGSEKPIIMAIYY